MRARVRLGALVSLASIAACSAAPARVASTHPGDLPASRGEPAPHAEVRAAAAIVAPPSEDRADRAKTAPATDEAPPPASTDDRPRMGATDFHAWIYKRPKRKGLPLGYIRIGTSVPLLSPDPVPGEGCPRGWYAVAPRGYACLSHDTTLDLEDPYYKALASVAPKDGVWAYSYAFSNDAPMYSRVPTPEEAERIEKRWGPAGSFQRLPDWSRGHEETIVDEPIVATDPVPDFFAGGKRAVGGGTRDPRRLLWRVIPNGSMLAYAKAFEANGRVWLLTPDLMLVPADRVRKQRRSTFHGVDLGHGVELPLAWNRAKTTKPIYERKDDGSFVASGTTMPPKSWIEIADAPVRAAGETYYELRKAPGSFVRESDMTFTRARSTLPRGVSPGQKWIEVKIVPGTLTAYEGLTPVRATMFSPGKGGVPVPGTDPNVYATTSIGFFPIEWKDRVATMTAENGEPKLNWISDVPNIQYLKAPLAMHVAFWHEDFGNPKSAECVNVAPEDGHWLFHFTDPALPEGWGGIRPGDGNGPSTPVVITAR